MKDNFNQSSITKLLPRKNHLSFLTLVVSSLMSQAIAQAQTPPWELTGNDLHNTNSGNVGIGTTNPSNNKLDVEGSGTADEDVLWVNNQGPFASRMVLRTQSQTAYFGISDPSATDPLLEMGGLPGALHFGVNNVMPIQFWNSDGTKRTVRMTISKTGNVGIGTTTTPSQKLEVVGNAKITGDLEVSGNLAAKYQDVAEWVKSSKAMLPGTVAILDSALDNQVLPSDIAYDTRVAGVISTQPGIALGEKGAEKVLVAAAGRVRVKATASNGPIAIGDLLVTSGRTGTAMRSTTVDIGGISIHRPGTVLGKALQSLKEGDGEILVLLTLQ